MVVRAIIKPSLYHDSVTLMNVARELRAMEGVDDAALVMGTEANKGLLAQADLLVPKAQTAKSDDLIVVVKGEEKAVDGAVQLADELLAKGLSKAVEVGVHRPRSLRGALLSRTGAKMAVISVAGQYAVAEAWQALEMGSHVLLFSDNVSLEDEIALKRYAVDHDLLMMGPGAGTAIINGVGLGFANALSRGPVGLLSAAGTGLQEVSSLLEQQGIGLSQGIGLGGRDLSDEVGGLMMFHAMEALQNDPETEVLIAISKLPSKKIANQVETRLKAGAKPAVVMFMGGEEDGETAMKVGAQLFRAGTLHETSLIAAALVKGQDPGKALKEQAEKLRALEERARSLRGSLTAGQKYLRGLFSGGTLCDEAVLIWSRRGFTIWSNRPRSPIDRLENLHESRAHCALDLGEEEFTLGRPHPMIDHDLRLRRLHSEAQDPTVAVIQLDVVLGYGAHPDPAGEIGPAIAEAKHVAKARGDELIVVASITGTDSDPQNRSRQQSILEQHGALVFESNAMASVFTAQIVDPEA